MFRENQTAKKALGLFLFATVLCILMMAFTGCNVSAGDPNENPISGLTDLWNTKAKPTMWKKVNCLRADVW